MNRKTSLNLNLEVPCFHAFLNWILSYNILTVVLYFHANELQQRSLLHSQTIRSIVIAKSWCRSECFLIWAVILSHYLLKFELALIFQRTVQRTLIFFWSFNGHQKDRKRVLNLLNYWFSFENGFLNLDEQNSSSSTECNLVQQKLKVLKN